VLNSAKSWRKRLGWKKEVKMGRGDSNPRKEEIPVRGNREDKHGVLIDLLFAKDCIERRREHEGDVVRFLGLLESLGVRRVWTEKPFPLRCLTKI
jgi:hypothetical protein